MATATYRTSCGLGLYKFDFVEHREHRWRAYLLKMPACPWRLDYNAIHLLKPNKPYVCWTRAIKSASDCHKIAGMWADSAQGWIANRVFQPIEPYTHPDVGEFDHLVDNETAMYRFAIGDPGSYFRTVLRLSPNPQWFASYSGSYSLARDSQGNLVICWPKRPKSREQAASWARRWAELVQPNLFHGLNMRLCVST